MNTRIREVREHLGLNQEEFATKINLKRNSLSLIEVGKRNASSRTIADICREFNVNEKWLRSGCGEMFHPTSSNLLNLLAEEYHLSHGSYLLIEKFLNLKPEIQQVFFDYAVAVANSLANDTALTQQSSECKKIESTSDL